LRASIVFVAGAKDRRGGLATRFRRPREQARFRGELAPPPGLPFSKLRDGLVPIRVQAAEPSEKVGDRVKRNFILRGGRDTEHQSVAPGKQLAGVPDRRGCILRAVENKPRPAS
jgi:hypothetical protein